MGDRTRGRRERNNIPFLLELVAQLKNFYFHLTLAVMLQDSLVGLALDVAHAVKVLLAGVGGGPVVARAEVRQVALHVARGPATSGRGEADVV